MAIVPVPERVRNCCVLLLDQCVVNVIETGD